MPRYKPTKNTPPVRTALKKLLYAFVWITLFLSARFVTHGLLSGARSAVAVWQGTEWTGTERFVAEAFVHDFNTFFGQPSLPKEVLQELKRCYAEAMVPLLNASGCPCRYRHPLTSSEAFDAAQEACFAEKGLPAAAEAATLACMREHVPQDWRFASDMVKQVMLKWVADAHLEDGELRITNCLTDKMLTFLDEQKSGPFDFEAKSLDTLVRPITSALPTEIIEVMVEHCLEKHASL